MEQSTEKKNATPTLNFMGIQQLADIYKIKATKISKDIKGCKPLWDELKRKGYNPSSKGFYPEQIKIIFKYFGDPRETN
jgi:hypothetical protein